MQDEERRPQATQKQNEEVYPVQTLVSYSERLFEQPAFVVQGAISKSNLSGNLSVAQVKQAVEEFLAQKDTRHQEE